MRCARRSRRRGLDVSWRPAASATRRCPAPRGYRRDECFYRVALGQRAAKALQHPLDMAAACASPARRRGGTSSHFQWLPLPPRPAAAAPVPAARRAHRPRRAAARGARRRARRHGGLLRAVDAVVVHSQAGARRSWTRLGVPAERVHVIPHGAFEHLARCRRPRAAAAAVAGLDGRPRGAVLRPVRPYKGVDLLVEAFAGDARRHRAAGRGHAAHVARSRSSAARRNWASPSACASWRASCPTRRSPAYFRRADVVALPYRETEQSGVLYTALAFGTPLLLSAVGGFPEIARARRRAAGRSPAASSRCARSSRALLDDEPATRARCRRRPLALAAGDHSWDARRRAHRGALPQAAGGAARVTAVEVVFWVSLGADRLRARRLSAAAARPWRCAPGAQPPAERAATPSVSLIVAAHDEEDVIEAEARQHARARLPARAARGDRRLGRVGDRRRRSRAPRDGGADVLDLPRRRKVPARTRPSRQATRRVLAFSDANAFWDPDALRELVRAVRRSARRLRVRPASYLSAGRVQPGGRLLALRDWVRALESRTRLGHRRQRRDLRRAARGLHAPRPAHQPRPLVPVQHGEARLAGGLRAGGRGGRAAGASDRGRVPRASGA